MNAPVPTIFPYNVFVPETLLQTKQFLRQLRLNLVARPHLINRLNQGLRLGHKLTLISAPVGFGKTKLLNIIRNVSNYHQLILLSIQCRH